MYTWHWTTIWQNADVLLGGIGITVLLSIIVILIGTLLGLGFALLQRADHPIVTMPVHLLAELLRDIPILVLLIWLYYVLPQFGVMLSGFSAAIIGLSLSHAAFVSKSIRAGIESIPKGHTEAAKILGYNSWQRMRYIILPQALRSMLPNLMNLSVHQIKNTSLASVIAVDELLHMTNVLISNTYRPLELYTAVAVLYLLIIIPLVWWAKCLEKSYTRNVKTA